MLADPAIAAVCADLARLARERFDKAGAALLRCARRPMRPAIAMMAVYRRILDRLEQRGWSRLDEPVGLSMPEKLMLVLRHGLL